MTDGENIRSASQTAAAQNPIVGPALMDVLIRGLEAAKRNLEDNDTAEPREFCALFYGTPGTFCTIAYYHPPQQ